MEFSTEPLRRQLERMFVFARQITKTLQPIPEHVQLQVGKSFYENVPGNMRTELWMSVLQRKGIGAKAAAAFSQYLKQEVAQEVVYEIEKDLARTFPEFEMFAMPAGLESLSRVLRAYAARDSAVGYCQGMNFIAGLLLMWLRDEAAAFGALVVLMEEQRMRELYSEDMRLMQVRMRQMTALMSPRLIDHLESCGILPELYAPPMLLTCFASHYPVDFAARVMDVVLTEGYEAGVMRAAVAIMTSLQPTLLRTRDVERALSIIKTNPPSWPLERLHELLNGAFAADWSPAQAAVLRRLGSGTGSVRGIVVPDGGFGGDDFADDGSCEVATPTRKRMLLKTISAITPASPGMVPKLSPPPASPGPLPHTASMPSLPRDGCSAHAVLPHSSNAAQHSTRLPPPWLDFAYTNQNTAEHSTNPATTQHDGVLRPTHASPAQRSTVHTPHLADATGTATAHSHAASDDWFAQRAAATDSPAHHSTAADTIAGLSWHSTGAAVNNDNQPSELNCTGGKAADIVTRQNHLHAPLERDSSNEWQASLANETGFANLVWSGDGASRRRESDKDGALQSVDALDDEWGDEWCSANASMAATQRDAQHSTHHDAQRSTQHDVQQSAQHGRQSDAARHSAVQQVPDTSLPAIDIATLAPRCLSCGGTGTATMARSHPVAQQVTTPSHGGGCVDKAEHTNNTVLSSGLFTNDGVCDASAFNANHADSFTATSSATACAANEDADDADDWHAVEFASAPDSSAQQHQRVPPVPPATSESAISSAVPDDAASPSHGRGGQHSGKAGIDFDFLSSAVAVSIPITTTAQQVDLGTGHAVCAAAQSTAACRTEVQSFDMHAFSVDFDAAVMCNTSASSAQQPQLDEIATTNTCMPTSGPVSNKQLQSTALPISSLQIKRHQSRSAFVSKSADDVSKSVDDISARLARSVGSHGSDGGVATDVASVDSDTSSRAACYAESPQRKHSASYVHPAGGIDRSLRDAAFSDLNPFAA